MKKKAVKKTADDDDDNTQYAESKLGADVLINFLRAGAFDTYHLFIIINHQSSPKQQTTDAKHTRKCRVKKKKNDDLSPPVISFK
jgi:hypothetical protein